MKKLKLNSDNTYLIVLASVQNRSNDHVSTLEMPNNAFPVKYKPKSLSITLEFLLSMELRISNVC